MKKNRRFSLLATVVLTCGFLLLVSTASATVVGTLATGSSGTVTATTTSVTFSNDSAGLGGSNFACPPASAQCDSNVSSGTTLSFAGCSGVLGSAGCLSAQEAIDVNSPIGPGSVGENNFLTFSNNANLVYSLLAIATYSNAGCLGLSVGQSCVIYPGAALLLTLESNGTQVTLSVSGKASDTGIAGLATGASYVGGFTQLLTGNLPNGQAPTPANIQVYFCGTNNVTTIAQCDPSAFLTSSQSGSFTANAVPEPSSVAMVLLGGGLTLLGIVRRNNKSRS